MGLMNMGDVHVKKQKVNGQPGYGLLGLLKTTK
jgi:hypothetical protein